MMHECWLPELEYFEDYQNSCDLGASSFVLPAYYSVLSPV